MQKTRPRIVAAVAWAAALTAACAGDEPSESPLGPGGLAPAGHVDISGEYAWSESQGFIMSATFIEAVGVPIVPEGPFTLFRCENSGAMMLEQVGDSFTGTASQSGECVTTGGQMFPSLELEGIPLINGRIRGRRIAFDFSDPGCPYQGELQIENGQVVGVRGTGQCGPLAIFTPFDQLAISRWQATRM